MSSYICQDPIACGFLGGSDSRESACSAGDLGLIPGLGRSPGEGKGNPLQYSCLENSMDREAWWSSGCQESDMTEQLTVICSIYTIKMWYFLNGCKFITTVHSCWIFTLFLFIFIAIKCITINLFLHRFLCTFSHILPISLLNSKILVCGT